MEKVDIQRCANPLCAILALDDARIKVGRQLVRPAMKEVWEVTDAMIHLPMDVYLRPSMQCEIEKVCTAFVTLDWRMYSRSVGKLHGVRVPGR